MHEGSIEAFYELQAGRKLQPMQHRILHALHNKGPLTREELGYMCDMKLSSVCGRVKALIELNMIEECGYVLINKFKQTLVKIKVHNA